MPTNNPIFITFDGIDGAGKSSSISAVVKYIEDLGHEVVLTREPGGTPLAEKLRNILIHDSMDPITEALISFAGRRDHLMTKIEPALAEGKFVVSDRFSDAAFAFQGAGNGCPIDVLTTLEQMVQTGAGEDKDLFRKPDLTFWFDLPVKVALSRLDGARDPDKFESQKSEFFERVRKGYEDRYNEDPDRFIRINANQPLDCVIDDVIKGLEQHLKQSQRPGPRMR